MRYTLALVSLLVNFTYAQCDYSDEFQCSSNSDCNWEESIEWYSCSNFTSSDQCNSYSQYGCYTSWNSTTWEDDCNGPSFQIDNSYCEEINIFECSEMNELECNNNGICDWVDNIEYGNCSNYNNGTTCDANENCFWDLCYGGSYGSWSHCCRGGAYQTDNSYCQEIEILECSEMNELQCNQDGSCSWVNDLDSGNCWDYNNSNSCNSNNNCNWTSYQQACTGTGYTDCVSQSPECSYSWLEYTCTGSYTVSYCGGGNYEIDNGYCEELSFIPGDTNGDGVLNVSDVVLIVQTILSGDYDENSDYNQDGTINITDVIGIINIILGK